MNIRVWGAGECPVWRIPDSTSTQKAAACSHHPNVPRLHGECCLAAGVQWAQSDSGELAVWLLHLRGRVAEFMWCYLLWFIAMPSIYTGAHGSWMLKSLLFARSWQLSPPPAALGTNCPLHPISSAVTWLHVHFVMERINTIAQTLGSPDAPTGEEGSAVLCLALFPSATVAFLSTGKVKLGFTCSRMPCASLTCLSWGFRCLCKLLMGLSTV